MIERLPDASGRPRSVPVLPHRFRARPDRALRLWCFPHAGGGVSAFRGWPACLPASIEVWSVELPGRDTRIAVPPFTSMSPLVEAIVEAIGPLLDRPSALFGHSLGALLAFEVARALRSRGGAPPLALFVSGCRAPQLGDRRRRVHRLPREAFLEAVRELSGTPDEVLSSPELVELLLPMLRADFTVSETYRYVDLEPLQVPLIACCGAEDREVSAAEMAAWHKQTTAGFRLRLFAGGHFFVRTALAPLLAAISEDLLALAAAGARPLPHDAGGGS